MTDVAQRPPLASVALLSSAALATEILLSRSFAVVHWHHFAYMIISLALLGFGASGTFLALAHRRLLRHFAASYLGNVAAFGILVVASPVLAQALPFQAEALLWDPWQPLWLVLLYLVLSTPFFCAANAIGLALIAFRDCAGRVYAADLVGAGLGSVTTARPAVPALARGTPEDHRRRGLRGDVPRRARTAGAPGSVGRRRGDRSRSDHRDPDSSAQIRARALQGTEPGIARRWHAGHARAIESARPRQRDRKPARSAPFCARLEPEFHERAAGSAGGVHRRGQPAGHHGRERR